MPAFSSSGVQNFQLPTPGNAVLVTLKFSAGDNGVPFGFQNLGNQIPNNYTPQGVIIDTRNVATAQTVQVTIGGTTPFEITQAAGVYASYLVPAFDIAVITVAGLQSTDTMIVYCANFPLFPQQYGVPNVTINLSSPGPIGNTTPNTGAFTDLKADTVEVATSITVPAATEASQPIQLSQAEAMFQPAGTYVNTFNSRSGAVALTQGDVTGVLGNYVITFNGRAGAVSLSGSDVTTALGFTPMANNSTGTSASTWGLSGDGLYLGNSLAGLPGINLAPDAYINTNGTSIFYNTNTGNHVFNANCIAPNFTLSSDRKFKREIKPIRKARSPINALKPKTFLKNGKWNSGFIAQDMMKIPELRHLVLKEKSGLHVDYIGLIAWIVKRLQEMDT